MKQPHNYPSPVAGSSCDRAMQHQTVTATAMLQGAQSWIDQVPAMGAAMAAFASAAGAANPVHAATQFQHGSTQFNHCHFTQSMAPPAQVDGKAGPLNSSQALSQAHDKSHAVLAARSGSLAKSEPSEGAVVHPVASNAAQPSAGTPANAASPESTPGALGDRLQLPPSKEPKKAVRFKPAHLAAKPSSSLPRTGREVGKARPMHASSRPHTAQPKHSTAQKSRNRTETQIMDGDRDALLAQPAFDYAKALVALDSQGAGHLHQLHSTGEPERGAGFRVCA